MIPDARNLIKFDRADEFLERSVRVLKELGPEEISNWVANPVTHALVLSLLADEESAKNLLCDGGSLGSTSDEVVIKTTRLIAKAQSASDILEWVHSLNERVEEARGM